MLARFIFLRVGASLSGGLPRHYAHGQQLARAWRSGGASPARFPLTCTCAVASYDIGTNQEQC